MRKLHGLFRSYALAHYIEKANVDCNWQIKVQMIGPIAAE